MNRSTYTKHYETLKKEATAQKRTAFEFCLWFDFQLVRVANLNTGVLSCIMYLIENDYISTDKHIKNFRLACIIFHKFMQLDKKANDAKCKEYMIDHPDIIARLNTKIIAIDFKSYLNYNRTSANKQMFPFFCAKGIDTNLIAELISRQLLAFDCQFRNLIFISRTETEIVGVEKLGIINTAIPKFEGTKPICWNYWVDRKSSISFKTDIKKVIFFDTTIRLQQYLTKNYPQENTLYCSLHIDYCLIETYTNTLEVLSDDVEIHFNFENQEAIQRLRYNKKEIDIFELEVQIQIPATSTPIPIVVNNGIREVSKMVWDDEIKAYYDATDDSIWNENGTEFSPF